MMVNKRKAIPKSIRMTIYQKCDGHCAYCGMQSGIQGYAD